MNRKLTSILQFTFFLALGVAIIVYIYIGLSAGYVEDCVAQGGTDCSFSRKIMGDFARVKLGWIGLILVLFMVSNWSRAMRWMQLVRALGYQPRRFNAFFTVMLGYFANMGLPRMGEFVRAGSFARYERIPVDRVIGTVVTDRIFDMLSLLIVILLALVLEYDMLTSFLRENAQLPGVGWLSGPWLALFAVGLAWLGLRYHRWLIARLPRALGVRLQALIDGIVEGILSVKKLKSPGWFVVHSIVIWSAYFLMTYLCFFSFPPTSHLGPTAALMVFVFGSLGMIVPTPGGLGSFHYLVVVALGMYGIGEADSFSFALIIYLSVAISCNVLFGILALILLPLYNRNRKTAAPDGPIEGITP